MLTRKRKAVVGVDYVRDKVEEGEEEARSEISETRRAGRVLLTAFLLSVPKSVSPVRASKSQHHMPLL